MNYSASSACFARTLPLLGGAVVIWACLQVTDAWAQEGATPSLDVPKVAEPATPEGPVLRPEEQRAALLDSLLMQLASAPELQGARFLEEEIWKLWLQSGSDSVDLLMGFGISALEDDRLEEALKTFSHVTTLAPGYSEGWNKRATVHFMLDDYQGALADIEQVLRLEPRHFGALNGLAIILLELGDKEGALAAYRKALSVHPHLEGVEDAIDQLSIAVEGRGI